jgi:hypothetical protein
MQSNLISTLPINGTVRVECPDASEKSGPVELDLNVLSQVGGGLGPAGTWSTSKDSQTLGPAGTW